MFLRRIISTFAAEKKVTMRKNYQTKQTVRFRRWSRKNYAMFFSVGRQVTIGFLAKGVLEVALRKQKAKTILSFFTGQQEEDFRNEAEREMPDFGLLAAILWPEVISEPACGAKNGKSVIDSNIICV